MKNGKHINNLSDKEQKNIAELINILKKLVSLRSDVDSLNNESKVANYIINIFSKLTQWSVKTQQIGAGRKNIIIKNSNNPQIVLIGHQDTVSVNNREQLKPKIKDNKLYGRGSVDMKSGLAIMIALAKQYTLKNAAFVFTVDEEYHFAGIKKFVEKNKWKPRLVINPEPTDLKILNQCRGFTEVYLELEGLSTHAGQKHKGINAIENSVKFASIFENLLQKNDQNKMKTSTNLAALEGGILVKDKIIIRPNVVPDFAKLTIEIRLANPNLTKKEIKKLALISAKKVGLKIRKYANGLLFGPMTAHETHLGDFLFSIKKNKIKPRFMDPNKSGFYEVQLLQSIWDCPIIVVGAGPNDKSHQIDEYVDLNSLKSAYFIIRDFLLSQEII